MKKKIDKIIKVRNKDQELFGFTCFLLGAICLELINIILKL